jgi:hypothetical protein
MKQPLITTTYADSKGLKYNKTEVSIHFLEKPDAANLYPGFVEAEPIPFGFVKEKLFVHRDIPGFYSKAISIPYEYLKENEKFVGLKVTDSFFEANKNSFQCAEPRLLACEKYVTELDAEHLNLVKSQILAIDNMVVEEDSIELIDQDADGYVFGASITVYSEEEDCEEEDEGEEGYGEFYFDPHLIFDHWEW